MNRKTKIYAALLIAVVTSGFASGFIGNVKQAQAICIPGIATCTDDITGAIADYTQEFKLAINCIKDSTLCAVYKIVQSLAEIVKSAMIEILSYLFLPVMVWALSIQPHTPAFANLILTPWFVIRNLMNVIFILALIVVALATLLRISGYDYKGILLRLVIFALLINFSMTIAQAVLGIADTLQAQFLPAQEITVRALFSTLVLSDTKTDQLQHRIAGPEISASSMTFAAIAFEIMLVWITLATFAIALIVTIFLMIRIVALWFLLMLSPVPYGMSVLPSTRKYATMWWNYFIRYAFFTPLLGLFLHITALITQQTHAYLGPGGGGAGGLTNSPIGQFILESLASYLPVIFLYFGYKAAKGSGIAGANLVTSKVAKWTNNVAVAPVKYARDKGLQIKDNKVASINRAALDKKVNPTLMRAFNLAVAPKKSYEEHKERVVASRKESSIAAATAIGTTSGASRSSNFFNPARDAKGKRIINDNEADKELKTKNLQKYTTAFKGLSGSELSEAIKRLNSMLEKKPKDAELLKQKAGSILAAGMTKKDDAAMRADGYDPDDEDQRAKFYQDFAKKNPYGKTTLEALHENAKTSGRVDQMYLDETDKTKRETLITERVEQSSQEEFEKLNPKYMRTYDASGNMTKFGQALAKQISKRSDQKINLNVAKKLLGDSGKVDLKNGRIVADSPQTVQAIKNLYKEDSAAFERLYNRAFNLSGKDLKHENFEIAQVIEKDPTTKNTVRVEINNIDKADPVGAHRTIKVDKDNYREAPLGNKPLKKL